MWWGQVSDGTTVNGSQPPPPATLLSPVSSTLQLSLAGSVPANQHHLLALFSACSYIRRLSLLSSTCHGIPPGPPLKLPGKKLAETLNQRIP